MHELSLAGSIVQIVEDAARQDGFARVRSLRLAVPRLAGVEVSALRFALRSLAPRTLLDGAEFRIDEPPSRAQCLDCGRAIEVSAHGEACPRCGGHAWQLDGDAGLRVVYLLVE